jgi:mRNA-degrading endonuclease RelE of RelBE toxin-antitoxin system
MIIKTRRYRESVARLPNQDRKLLAEKVHILEASASYNSLRVHKLKNAPAQVVHIGRRYRLLFRQEGADLVLLDVGTHSLIDKLRRKVS